MNIREFSEKAALRLAKDGQSASGSIITIIELLLPVIIELIQGCTDEDDDEAPVKMITEPNLLQMAVLRQAVNREMRSTGRGWRRRAREISTAIRLEARKLSSDEIKELLA